jgi:hypothetical protein
MWTRTTGPLTGEEKIMNRIWRPNHFIPLLKKAPIVSPPVYRCNSTESDVSRYKTSYLKYIAGEKDSGQLQGLFRTFEDFEFRAAFTNGKK